MWKRKEGNINFLGRPRTSHPEESGTGGSAAQNPWTSDIVYGFIHDFWPFTIMSLVFVSSLSFILSSHCTGLAYTHMLEEKACSLRRGSVFWTWQGGVVGFRPEVSGLLRLLPTSWLRLHSQLAPLYSLPVCSI